MEYVKCGRCGETTGECRCPDPLEEDRPNPPPPKPRLTAAEWLQLNEAERQAKEAAKLRADEEARRRWREAQEERASQIVDEFLAQIDEGQDIWGDGTQPRKLPETKHTPKEVNDLVAGQLKMLGFRVNPYRVPGASGDVFSTEVGKPTPGDCAQMRIT